MLVAAVSTVALALALGPHLQVSLQAAIENAQPITEPAEPDTGEVSIETTDVETGDAPDPVEADMSTDIPADPEIAEPAVADAEPDTVTDATTDTDAIPISSDAVAEADWPGILDAASAALSASRTATGKFMQTNDDGTITTGTFALNRPGRMRFDYDEPTPVLIVSDGITVAIEDSELETIDRVPIGATPLGLILSTDLNVADDIDVLNVMQNADRVGVRVADASGELDGTLTMVFDNTTYDLLGWLATDGNLQTTVVDLLDVETNVRVDPRLFRLDDAEDEEDER